METASGLKVSHEAIYTAIYAQPRRGRKPKGGERRGKLCDMTNIKERPEEIESRLVPGHWEGDLIIGAGGASAIGTLVERTTRFIVLVRMPTRKADVAGCAFAGALNAIPAPLRKTLTYDRGKEMAEHQKLALDTGMRVFFAELIRTRRGSAAPTKIPMACCASIFRRGRRYRDSTRTTLTPSRQASTIGPARPSASQRRTRCSPPLSRSWRAQTTCQMALFATELESADHLDVRQEIIDNNRQSPTYKGEKQWPKIIRGTKFVNGVAVIKSISYRTPPDTAVTQIPV